MTQLAEETGAFFLPQSHPLFCCARPRAWLAVGLVYPLMRWGTRGQASVKKLHQLAIATTSGLLDILAIVK